MRSADRYTVPEDEDYEPGSKNQVLKNYLGATSKEVIQSPYPLRLRVSA